MKIQAVDIIEIPQVMVNLQVKYHDNCSTAIIPCYSWDECERHEDRLAGTADTARRKL